MAIKLTIKKWSAWLDLSQSLSGVILAVFLWTHLVLVSSILLGSDAMNWVARTMELSFLSDDGHGYPWVVTGIAMGIAALALVHVLVALQKLPMSLRQQRALRQQMQVINHSDTRLWRWQAITGVVILLLLPVHLWLIGSAPETIGTQGERRPYLEPMCVDGLPAFASYCGVTCSNWYLPCGFEMGRGAGSQ